MKNGKLPAVVVIVFLVTITFYRLCNTSADLDLWGYLSFGKFFWETGCFPYHDLFSYTAKGQPWIYHEWLTGVFLYKVFELFGDVGLQILRYVVGFFTAGLVYGIARLRGAGKLSAAFGVLFASIAFGIGYAPVRAQVFTYLFFVLTAYILEAARKKESWAYLLLLIPIQILWCNLHGGFIAGLGLVALYAFGQLLSRSPFIPFVLALIGSVISTLVNPYGIYYWSKIFVAISMRREFIPEWWPALTALKAGYQTSNHVFFIFLFALSLVALVWYRWKDITDILVIAVTAFLGFRSNRHEVFFFLSFGAFLPIVFMPYINRLTSDPKFQKFIMLLDWKRSIVLTAFLIIFPIYNISRVEPLRIELYAHPTAKGFYYPLGAIKYIEDQNLVGNILTDFDWGEFVIWQLYPKCLVAMDGRYETIYSDAVFESYIEFYFASNDWQNFLDDYPHDMILIKKSAPIYPVLQRQEIWREAYSDIGSALFVRSDS
jgi:hypothetical protein